MKKLNALLVSAGLALGSAGVMANPNAPEYTPPPPPAPQAQAADVSDRKLEKFVDIYIDVESTRNEMVTELNNVEDPAKAQEIQAKMRDEIIATIEDHGWTLNEYNQMAQTIMSDQALKEKTLQMINEHSS